MHTVKGPFTDTVEALTSNPQPIALSLVHTEQMLTHVVPSQLQANKIHLFLNYRNKSKFLTNLKPHGLESKVTSILF